MILPALCLYVFIGIQLWVARYVHLYLSGHLRSKADHLRGILALIFLFIPFWPAFLMRGAIK